MADRLALFSIVIGIALLLSGIGFGVLAYATLSRRRSGEATVAAAAPVKPSGRAVVA